MKNRALSLVLCLALLVSAVAGIGAVATADTVWVDGTNGIGQYAVVAESDLTALGTNRLAGLTPTVKDEAGTTDSFGDSLAKLTDGSFGTAAGDYAATTQKAFSNEWACITYDLGKTVEVTGMLAASPLRDTATEGDWFLRWIKVYVGDSADTLFTSGNLVAQALKLGDEYADVQLKPEGGSATGQYVGFQFWVPGARGTFDNTADLYTGTNLNFTDTGTGVSKNQWGVLQIGELAVYGRDAINWQTGTNGIGQYAATTEADMLALGTNRLAGVTPSIVDEAGTVESFGDSLAKLTDGSFGTAVGDYAATTQKSLANEWASLSFDLTKSVEITEIVAASPLCSDVRGLRWIKVYVADDASALFTGTNLVAQALKLGNNNNDTTYGNVLLKPQGGSATGRYVGFQFWVPGARGTFDSTADLYTGTNLNFTDTGTALSRNRWGVLEIGELAVFGKDAINWQTGTDSIGKYAATTEADMLTYGTNRLVGLTPSIVDEAGTVESFGDSLTYLADGSFGAVVGDYAATTQKSLDNEWASLSFDLGYTTAITKVLAASPLRDTATEGDWYLRWIKVYVSNDAATLFADTNLVAQALKLDTAYEDVILQPQGGSATGRYVGFRFWVPGKAGTFDDTADMYTGTNLNFTNAGSAISKNQWGVLQIGELAVYGAQTAVPSSMGAQVRGDYNPDGSTALRFGFNATISGLTADGYVGNYAAATVVVADKTYDVVTAGALLVPGHKGSGADLEIGSSNAYVKDVAAEKVYSIEGSVVTYTVVVTNITADYLETLVWARPYVAYRDGGEVKYVYGEAISRSAQGVKDVTSIQ